MQCPCRVDFKAVFINPNRYGAAGNGIVPVTEGVSQCFTERLRGIKRLVHALESTWHDTPGNRQIFYEELLRSLKQVECVAVELPIVQEFTTVNAPKFRDAQHAL